METRDRQPANASLIFLFAANLLPLIGVVSWGWSIFEIVSLYWFENLVIGVVNALKIITCCPVNRGHDVHKAFPRRGGHRGGRASSNSTGHVAKLFLVPFFAVHYGIFCFGHGIFVFSLLGGKNGDVVSGDLLTGIKQMISQVFFAGGQWFALAIIASHGFSFFFHYLGRGEFRRVSPPQLMMAPYGRIVILHVAIIFGAFFIQALGSPVFLLFLLVGGKIALELKLYWRSYAKLSGSPHPLNN